MKVKSLFLSASALAGVFALSGCDQTEIPASETVNGNGTIITQEKYTVGMTYFNALDMNRSETLSEQADAYRDVMLKVWYPAELTADSQPLRLGYHSKQYPYIEAITQTWLDDNYYSKAETLLSGAYSHADALDLNQPFPVLLYSPGFGSTMEDNETLMVDLASQGYIVVSVGHAYEAEFMSLSGDGQYATTNWGVWRKVYSYNDPSMNKPSWDLEMDNFDTKLSNNQLTEQDKERIYELYAMRTEASELLQSRSADLSFALVQLEKLNGGQLTEMYNQQAELTSLIGKLDFGNVGAVGWSFGGATVANFCTQEPLCKAAINLDGQHIGLSEQSPAHKPYLMLHSTQKTVFDGDPKDEKYKLGEMLLRAEYQVAYEQQQQDTFLVQVENSVHNTFSDVTITSPVFQPEWYTQYPHPEPSVFLSQNKLSKKVISDFFATYIKNQGEYSTLVESLNETSGLTVKGKIGN
ncbi:MAG: hypothetical protein GY787_00655 [Alteromonadales bacterium]|nr:hypothetical protein [Alteromonadales bacterium]